MLVIIASAVFLKVQGTSGEEQWNTTSTCNDRKEVPGTRTPLKVSCRDSVVMLLLFVPALC
jgi:hypothetical protein